ncbi:hypothetical protein ACTGJ9_023605 [Bradyrhizobium sp. RDM12]
MYRDPDQQGRTVPDRDHRRAAALASYDYLFYGTKKATFVIAELLEETKIKVIDEAWSPPIVNKVPSSSSKSSQRPSWPIASSNTSPRSATWTQSYASRDVRKHKSARREDRHDRSHIRDQ